MPALELPQQTAPAASETDLVSLHEIERRAAVLDSCMDEGDPAALAQRAHELRLLVERALEIFAGIQERDELEQAAAGEAWPCEDSAVFARLHLPDLCFAGTVELRRVRRLLADARLPSEHIIAAETARRKLCRGLRAVLAIARPRLASEPDSSEATAAHALDLAAALAVRRLYTSLRRSLRHPTEETPAAVLVALRYAAGGLATLFSAAEYTHVRASDRWLLRGLRERILAWSKSDQSLEAGTELLADVWATAELLRNINRRQELRAHDAELLSALSCGPDPGDESAWMARFEPLLGFDDALDRLMEEIRLAPGDRSLTTRLLERIAELR